MATKDLARSSMECGHGSDTNHLDRTANRFARHRSRALLSELRHGADAEEVAERLGDAELVTCVWRDVNFKGSVLGRWRDSWLNKPMDRAYGDLCRRFRRLRGRKHRTVFRNALFGVAPCTDPTAGRYGDYVDEAGIYRTVACNPRWRRTEPPVYAAEVERWLAGRGVRQVGAELFWIVSSARQVAVWSWDETAEKPALAWRTRVSRRQDNKLTAADRAYFAALPVWKRDALFADAAT